MAKLNRIAEVLKERGISQYRLHKDSGVSNALINSYCKNTHQPSLVTLVKLAKALKVPGKDLINF
jgi:transcriptional regulator with XRE-family HTH domain